MKSKLLFFVLVNLMAGSLLAQQPEGKTSPVQMPAWFNAADKDGDGKLSRDEAPNKEVFGDVDTDSDGFA
jgi:hypothetical protein